MYESASESSLEILTRIEKSNDNPGHRIKIAHTLLKAGLIASLGGAAAGTVASITMNQQAQNWTILLFKLGFIPASAVIAIQKELSLPVRISKIIEVILLTGAALSPVIPMGKYSTLLPLLLTTPVPFSIAYSFPDFPNSSKVLIGFSTLLAMGAGIYSLATSETPEKMFRGLDIEGAAVSLAFLPLAFGKLPLRPFLENFQKLSGENKVNAICMTITALLQCAALYKYAPPCLINVTFILLSTAALFLNLELMKPVQVATETTLLLNSESNMALSFGDPISQPITPQY